MGKLSERLNKKKLRDAIIVGVGTVAVLVTIILYSFFISDQIFRESSSHLTEIYDQINMTFQQMVFDTRKMLKSWKNYIVPAAENSDPNNANDELRLFIADQKQAGDFTDFYFVDTEHADTEVSTAEGKKSDGDKETLLFRNDTLDRLLNGEDIGAVVTRGEGANKVRYLMIAVSLTESADGSVPEYFDFNGFSYGAIAVVFDAEATQKALSIKAFQDTGSCRIILPDGTLLTQSQDKGGEDSIEGIIGDNYLEFLEQCTFRGTNLDQIKADWNPKEVDEEGNAQPSATVLFTYKGEEYYLTYMPVGFNDWMLLGSVPSSVVNSNMSRFRTVTIVVMAAIFACIGAVIAWMLIVSGRRRVKEKELQVKSREGLLDLLTQNTNNIFVLFTTQDYTAEYVSSNVERVLGLGIDEVQKDIRVIEKVSVDGNSAILTEQSREILQSGGTWETDLHLKNLRTGEEFWFRLLVNHSTLRGGYVMMLSDRTRERKMRDDLEEALGIAKTANEAKSNFLANMSHDIRTPMNAIIGFTTLLAKDAENPEKVREYVRKITFSSRHLLSLINDILDMSKIESGKTSLNVEEFDFSEFLQELYSMILPQSKAKKQEFEVTTKGHLPEAVFGDKLRINQILLNLLSNAIKYTPAGGRISLEVEALEEMHHNHAHLRLAVRDNGIGMSKDFIKVIFEPFSRETTTYTKEIQGTGLGMAITKNIVDLMGGTISVESEEGKGSTFVVELELAVAEKNADDEEFWKLHDIMKILVVDDEEDVCKEVQALMREAGVEVSFVLSGKQAVQLTADAFEKGEGFDIILLDWKMPEMDGVETAKRIRKKIGDAVPIMVLTSYSFEEIEDEARAAGIDLFLPKPFFVSNFRNAVMRLRKEDVKEKVPEPVAEEISLEGLHVLAAEDNAINAEILQELLDIEGMTCDVAENGKEALDVFRKCKPGTYDFIFMDVQMPVMNGYEATRAIRACEHPEAQSIPIIAMTANAFDDDVKSALDAGMNAHLAKPIDMNKLKELIAKLREKGK